MKFRIYLLNDKYYCSQKWWFFWHRLGVNQYAGYGECYWHCAYYSTLEEATDAIAQTAADEAKRLAKPVLVEEIEICL